MDIDVRKLIKDTRKIYYNDDKLKKYIYKKIFDLINNVDIRNLKSLTNLNLTKTKQYINDIEDIIYDYDIKSSNILFLQKSIDLDLYKDLMINSIIKIPNYFSVTYKDSNKFSNGEYKMKLTIPKGTPLIYISVIDDDNEDEDVCNSEFEILVPPGNFLYTGKIDDYIHTFRLIETIKLF